MGRGGEGTDLEVGCVESGAREETREDHVERHGERAHHVALGHLDVLDLGHCAHVHSRSNSHILILIHTHPPSRSPARSRTSPRAAAAAPASGSAPRSSPALSARARQKRTSTTTSEDASAPDTLRYGMLMLCTAKLSNKRNGTPLR